MRKREPKPKSVSYRLISRDDPTMGPGMYALLDELVDAHHSDLREARIALAWCMSWKPDVDGRVTLGQCKKASDLDRELAPFDFVILLRRAFWLDLRVNDAQRAALLDHELCHAARKFDDNGEPVVDERGRNVYRVRKHDIEEFTAIVHRHGTYKADLEDFAAALKQAGMTPYQPCERCQESPGWVRLTDDRGVSRVTRCECYRSWHQQRQDLLTA
jgi:hypothetical protein